MGRIIQFILLISVLPLLISYDRIRPNLEAIVVPWYVKYIFPNVRVPLTDPKIYLRTFQMNLQNTCLTNNEFDFIIVGSGASGSALAGRLSEVQNFKVLLLEAGHEPLRISTIPLIAFKALWSDMDWQFKSEPQMYCCKGFRKKVFYFSRGKALGGSSAINFMTYTRGNKRDFDNWVKLGAEGWGWDTVFPYFLKLENYQVVRDKTSPSEKYHREGGPITAEIPTYKSPFAEAYLQAAYELGYNITDCNAESQIGFFYPPVFSQNGTRVSSYTGYVQPHLNRKNLKVLSDALVTKIIIDENKVAKGVEFEHYKSKCKAYATKEVIISAGVMQTPQLLMLSGIGPKETLDKFKIPVIQDLPGVGQNFHDHVIWGGSLYLTDQKETLNSVRYETAAYIRQWEKLKSGPMTVPVTFEGTGFVASKFSKDPNWPDLEMFFNSDKAIRIYKPYFILPLSALFPPDSKDGVLLVPILLRPKSRGFVSIRSTDIHDPPILDPQFLKEKEDLLVIVEGIRFATKFMKTRAMTQFNLKQFLAGIVPQCLLSYGNEQKYLECAASYLTSSGYHAAGSCKMGNSTDKMACVDPSLRVRGIKNLRVVDASVMPQVVAAHPALSCIVIAEKIADEIKKQYSKQ